MTKPGDWMESTQWLANAGHFLGGLSVILLTSMWAHDVRTVGVWTAFGVAAALVKEYYIDLRYESNETVGSSTIDFLGYMAGAAVGWLNLWALVAIRHWFG